MNKSGFRRMTILIAVSLVSLAGLQVYWLVRMYGDMNRRFAEKVTAAMERAAYDELVTRSTMPLATRVLANIMPAGELESVEIDKTDKGLSRVSMTTKSGSKAIERLDTLTQVLSGLPGTHVVTNGRNASLDSIKTTVFIQDQGNNRRLNIISVTSTDKNLNPEDFSRYDSLLGANLAQADIQLPYKLSIVEAESGKELSSEGDDIPNARTFDIPIGAEKASMLRLSIENPNRGFLREMAGLVVSAALIVILLGFSFVYLLRTLFRQKSLEEMRRDFTHNITHELKTPIAVAYAANDALLNYGADADPGRRQKYLEVGQDQLKTLSGMVERILTMSFEEKEDFPLSRSRQQLRPVIDRLAETYELKSRKPVAFSIDIPDDLFIDCDPFQLNIALGNLIDNAIKYSGPKAEVRISARRNDSVTEICITDKGTGIHHGAQDRIFEKFYRFPTGDLHEVKGFGLGLYYVRQIVEKHGGTIGVSSQPGRGTTFTLEIPGNGE